MKKALFHLFLSLLGLMLTLPAATQPRKKVAVVLSGGGAKGMAHIGALKVIEEAGIPIDFVVGTSMGAIVGGLYSIGYTPDQLDSLVKQQDWTFLLSDKVKRSEQTLIEQKDAATYLVSVPFGKGMKEKAFGGLIKGQNLSNLFSGLTVGYHDSISFDKLPIPFACVSENVVNGKPVVFRSGVLPIAMRASMAIPFVFTPVRQDSMVLVDGGMTNNFPTNVAKEMGADIIIGVDVQDDLKGADELNSVPEIMNQIIGLMGERTYVENKKLANAYIKVNVTGYSAASFTPVAIDTLIHRGQEAAESQFQVLLQLKQEIGIPTQFTPDYQEPYSAKSISRNVFIRNITFSGLKSADQKLLLRLSKLKENTDTNMDHIDKSMNILRGTQAYANVSYSLNNANPNGYNLDILLQEKYDNNLNLGIRFDSEEIASLLINATARLKTRVPSKASITGRLGSRYVATVAYSLEPMQLRSFNFAYQFQYNDINLYSKGKRTSNSTYKYHMGEFNFSDLWYKNTRFVAGLRFEYYKYKDFLFNNSDQNLHITPEHFFSYFIQLHHSTLNKNYFPTAGTDFKAGYNLYTDNLYNYKDRTPFSAINASWESAFSLTNRFALLPSIYGRVLIGDDIPYPYFNALGGYSFGRYVAQQIPFVGINHIEFNKKSLVVARLKARQRIGRNQYLSFTGNVALRHDNFLYIFEGKPIIGGGVSYGIDSRFGPLEASLNYSNDTQKVGFYVNLGYTF